MDTTMTGMGTRSSTAAFAIIAGVFCLPLLLPAFLNSWLWIAGLVILALSMFVRMKNVIPAIGFALLAAERVVYMIQAVTVTSTYDTYELFTVTFVLTILRILMYLLAAVICLARKPDESHADAASGIQKALVPPGDSVCCRGDNRNYTDCVRERPLYSGVWCCGISDQLRGQQRSAVICVYNVPSAVFAPVGGEPGRHSEQKHIQSVLQYGAAYPAAVVLQRDLVLGLELSDDKGHQRRAG